MCPGQAVCVRDPASPALAYSPSPVSSLIKGVSDVRETPGDRSSPCTLPDYCAHVLPSPVFMLASPVLAYSPSPVPSLIKGVCDVRGTPGILLN